MSVSEAAALITAIAGLVTALAGAAGVVITALRFSRREREEAARDALQRREDDEEG